jgi:guanylate kinase
MPPSVEELRARLIKRGTETPEDITMRVEKAFSEILLADSFDRVIVNDDLKRASSEICSVVKEFIQKR